jgi:hypothetical protein
MTSKLGRVTVTRKYGRERLREGSEELAVNLLSFWQWHASDFLSPTLMRPPAVKA